MSKADSNKDDIVEHIIDETPEWKLHLKRAMREVLTQKAKEYRTSSGCLVSGDNPKTTMTWNPTFFKHAISGKALEQVVEHEFAHLMGQGKTIDQAKDQLLSGQPDEEKIRAVKEVFKGMNHVRN